MLGYLQLHHRLGRRALSQTDWHRHECSSFSHAVGVNPPLRNAAAALRKERAAKDVAGRRLLIMGSHKQAARRGAPKGSLLQQTLVRKPRMLVAVALADTVARIAWALFIKQDEVQASGRGQGVSPTGRRPSQASVKVGCGTTVGENGSDEPKPSIVPARTLRRIWIRSESHTGPQPRRCTKRPDRWQHPPTSQPSKKTEMAK